MENKEGPSYTKLAVQGFFVVTVSALLLSWFGSKLKKLFSHWFNSGVESSETESAENIERYKQETEHKVEQLQKKHQEKSHEYNERILIPREEEKLRKKIEKLYRFSGPAWKGQGHVLGSEDDSTPGADVGTSDPRAVGTSESVRRRILPTETTREEVKGASQKEKPKKRVLEVPEEPETEGDNVTTIVFRTPLGTTCQRRFFSHNVVQNILDFITTKGFSQNVYTLATSFPRVILEDSTIPLSNLNLGQRFVLNIEERE